MSVYKYISEINPQDANNLCMSYGYPNAQSNQEIETYLISIVSDNGESGLIEVMKLHPDKDAILELFNTNTTPYKNFENTKEKFGSPTTDVQGKRDFGVPIVLTNYSNPNISSVPVKLNATGKVSITKNTNALILVSALIVSLAIISMNTK